MVITPKLATAPAQTVANAGSAAAPTANAQAESFHASTPMKAESIYSNNPALHAAGGVPQKDDSDLMLGMVLGAAVFCLCCCNHPN